MAVNFLIGDARERLKHLPDASVHCILTSPPYYGLRDYGTGTWEGGDPACDHLEKQAQGRPGRETPGGRGGSFPVSERPFKKDCPKCGARRVDQQIGLEASPDAYVAELVSVFREAKRVLRNDGVLWLNIGDSYCAHEAGNRIPRAERGNGAGLFHILAERNLAVRGLVDKSRISGIKPKDLIGIPWMVAFALRADGWYLRQDNIWAKTSCMPESVRDRTTRSHEYVFMFSKSQRYFYDAEAVKEPSLPDPRGRTATRPTRNKRSVWTIATVPYKGAHFACMPPALVEVCIKAGCPPGGTVLDPFAGVGTTALVAERLGRDSLGIELNPDYVRLAEARLAADRLGQPVKAVRPRRVKPGQGVGQGAGQGELFG